MKAETKAKRRVFQSAVRIAVWLKRENAGGVVVHEEVSIRRADRCLVEAYSVARLFVSPWFQSAVRIAVWLKVSTMRSQTAEVVVSIRRADRCLVEGAEMEKIVWLMNGFQSAVRIAVWLKVMMMMVIALIAEVSIRRADRCLVEDDHLDIRTLDVVAVSIRRADRCLVEVLHGLCHGGFFFPFQSAVRIAVWLKGVVKAVARSASRKFQSAVRIAVWLKYPRSLAFDSSQ